MEKMLHQLESFSARGSDGNTYRVRGYEHLTRLEAVRDAQGQWEPTGEAEYKLEDGRRVVVDQDGTMTVADSGVRLKRTERADTPSARRQPAARPPIPPRIARVRGQRRVPPRSVTVFPGRNEGNGKWLQRNRRPTGRSPSPSTSRCSRERRQINARRLHTVQIPFIRAHRLRHPVRDRRTAGMANERGVGPAVEPAPAVGAQSRLRDRQLADPAPGLRPHRAARPEPSLPAPRRPGLAAEPASPRAGPPVLRLVDLLLVRVPTRSASASAASSISRTWCSLTNWSLTTSGVVMLVEVDGRARIQLVDRRPPCTWWASTWRSPAP